ncbi:MAG TPA: LuxR C-terminal-related transcriptional regulator [Anaerolineales bacterium]|nr:LuxR C-terminal-related transcriptional regulator [Anaerolineales bacterium]
MPYQVLSTKLYIPPIHSSLVQRPRLVQILENGYQSGKRVTLVSAPAGFGKTTIIRQWITATELGKPFGWLSLDDGDNDPVRFLIYLVSAIQKVNAEIGKTILAALNSSQIPPLLDLVETLINEISFEAKPFLIVLDDYHLIKKVDAHSALQLLLKRQPEALHLVVITREDPPFSLPRMRVQGQITEIRERDLRFTLSEAQAFLARTMGLDLSAQDVGKLEERTEGWAAGMQLAALALDELSNDEERRAFIEAFTGSNRLIVDYLISEVLQRQAETTRQFLLRTSILERFNAELCDRVVFGNGGEGNSQSVLDILEQGNMFLVPLDSQRHWYRYHHLFSEMLFHSLRRSSPEQIPALHRKASEWFEAEGYIPEAMKHAIASKDWDFVAALLDRQAYSMVIQGFGNLVIEWCREIPKAYMEKSPNLCIYDAWALVLTFRNDFLEAVEEKLQMAGRAIEKPDLPAYAQVGQGGVRVPYKDWVAGHICVIRSQILLALFNNFVDPQALISLSLKGLELLPEVELTFRSTCRINLAIAELMQNNAAGAKKPLQEALEFALEAGNILGVVTIIVYQARLAYYMGQPDQAASLCRQWKTRFAEMTSASAAEVPATRGLDIMLGLILLERNQLEESERLFVRALELLGWASWIELHGFIMLARLRYLRGDTTGLQETLERMSRMGPQHAACAEAYDVLYAVKRMPDDPKVRSRAESWTNTHVLNSGVGFALGIGPYHCDTEYYINIAWAHVQISLGNFQAASSFIIFALENAKEQGLAFRVIELSIALALVYAGQSNPAAALNELEKALEIGERYGYARVFDDSPELDRLLQKSAEGKIHGQYARQLLTSFHAMRANRKIAGTASMEEKQHPDLVDPLSEREREVLRLLATGLPPAEVAKKLFLSPFTLKAHTQNIYTKLGVHSRIEAINKAREMDLL